MPIDYTTPVGQVRLLVCDVDESHQVFTDDQIQAFLALEGQNVKRAAAQAIDTNADNEALASKVLRSQDLSTDGAKVADAMRKHADRLREQADVSDQDTGSYFEIVDTVDRGPCWPELSGW